jgi:hypothetical protein
MYYRVTDSGRIIIDTVGELGVVNFEIYVKNAEKCNEYQ